MQFLTVDSVFTFECDDGTKWKGTDCESNVDLFSSSLIPSFIFFTLYPSGPQSGCDELTEGGGGRRISFFNIGEIFFSLGILTRVNSVFSVGPSSSVSMKDKGYG